MNHTTQRPAITGAFLQVQQSVAPWMDQVNELLVAELDFDCSSVDRLFDPQLFLGGKRMRPLLLLLCGKATGAVNKDHVTAAAIIEMVHLATLVHDDVLDSASTRRHRATINAAHGNQASVLAGDLLFSHAFYLASTMNHRQVAPRIALASRTVCHGEIRQTGRQGNWDLDETGYLGIIGQKTATLCACATELGAILSRATDAVSAAAREIGHAYGMAFQIVDDLLDCLGTDQSTGKTVGTDLDQLKLTLPLIEAFTRTEEQSRLEWQTRLSNGDATTAEIHDWLSQTGAVDYSIDKAREYVNCAWKRIDSISGQSQVQQLKLLGEIILDRTY